MANFVIVLNVNVVGLWLQTLTEAAQRKAFLDTRNCIAARLQMEAENEKLVGIDTVHLYYLCQTVIK